MRCVISLPLFIVLALPAGAAFGQSSTAKEIIDRAIKAQTDKPDDLSKRQIERVLMEGTVNLGGEKQAVREIIAERPGRLRYNLTLKAPEGEIRINMTLNNDRAWRISTGEPIAEFNLSQVDEFRAEAHGRWLSTLYPLKDAAFTLTVQGESRVEGEEVHSIKVSARFRPDVLMFFSKKSGHLIKVAYKTSDNGTPVRKEHIFTDYKKFGDLTLPGKLIDTQNGNKMGDYVVKEYKFLPKHDADVFSKPN